MPSYFYHLKFELYPLPDLDPNKVSKREREREVWVPSEGSDIFGSDTEFAGSVGSSSIVGSSLRIASSGQAWPEHKPVAWEQSRRRGGGTGSSTASVPEPHTDNTIKGVGDQIRGRTKGAYGGEIAAEVAKGGVIDCGPSRRAQPGESENLVILSTARDSQLESGPPSASLVDKKRNLRTSRKDWRFGRVRVESLNMDGVRGYHSRGEGSQGGIVGMNAGLEPGGRVTKARFEELHRKGENGLEFKNTELGWGVVHLYREGEETPGLTGVEVYNAGTAASPTNKERSNGLSEGGENEGNAEDCTILCIPAVPTYLTPRDFLGFVGEKTVYEVSHFRMVMTGRLNRYMVLMKFRDGNVARKWKTEWDGKVFNSMEVCSF